MLFRHWPAEDMLAAEASCVWQTTQAAMRGTLSHHFVAPRDTAKVAEVMPAGDGRHWAPAGPTRDARS
jgi:hypothetical protein